MQVQHRCWQRCCEWGFWGDYRIQGHCWTSCQYTHNSSLHRRTHQPQPYMAGTVLQGQHLLHLQGISLHAGFCNDRSCKSGGNNYWEGHHLHHRRFLSRPHLCHPQPSAMQEQHFPHVPPKSWGLRTSQSPQGQSLKDPQHTSHVIPVFSRLPPFQSEAIDQYREFWTVPPLPSPFPCLQGITIPGPDLGTTNATPN